MGSILPSLSLEKVHGFDEGAGSPSTVSAYHWSKVTEQILPLCVREVGRKNEKSCSAKGEKEKPFAVIIFISDKAAFSIFSRLICLPISQLG